MNSKVQVGIFGIGLLVLFCTAAIVNAVVAPGASVEHENVLPIPSAQRGRSSSSYNAYEPPQPVSPVGLILIFLFLLTCAIGPIIALLICFCPQIFPCKHIRNRKPGLGNCTWSDMTTYGYLRNRLQPQPVIVTVNMAQPQQYPGQNAPLMQAPIVIQQPPSPRGGGRMQPGFVYTAPVQQAVYTPPSYPATQPTQQPYNPNYPS